MPLLARWQLLPGLRYVDTSHVCLSSFVPDFPERLVPIAHNQEGTAEMTSRPWTILGCCFVLKKKEKPQQKETNKEGNVPMRPTDSASWRFGWIKHRRDSIWLEPRAWRIGQVCQRSYTLEKSTGRCLRLGQRLAQFVYFTSETSPAAPEMLLPRITPRQGHPWPRYFCPSSCQA